MKTIHAITQTGHAQHVEGKTLKEISQKLKAMLKVEGPRALTAITNTEATIHVELYENEDYIILANGRLVK